MANAAVLRDLSVIKTTTYTNLSFDLYGFLIEFKHSNGKTYKYVDRVNLNVEDIDLLNEARIDTPQYYPEVEFLKYLDKQITLKTLFNFRLSNQDVEFATEQDIVVLQKLHLTGPEYNNFCNVEIIKVLKKNAVLTKPSSINILNILSREIKNVDLDPAATLFYQARSYILTNEADSGNKRKLAYILANISLLINMINRDIFQLLLQPLTPDMDALIRDQNIDWATGTILESPSAEKLELLYKSLWLFYSNVYYNKLKISRATPNEKLYWLALSLTSESLSSLGLNIKFFLLNHLCKNKLSSNFEKLQDEELVIKILLSFDINNIDQINDILEKLISTKPDVNSSKSLYETLYDKMSTSTKIKEGFAGLSNWVFNTEFKPTKTKHLYVQAVYALWTLSKYNPYSDTGDLKANVFNFRTNDKSLVDFTYKQSPLKTLFTYTHYTASIQVESTPLNRYEIKYSDAAPILIPYESKKFIDVFFANFKFKFDKGKIKAYEALPIYTGDKANIDEIFWDRNEDVLYGTYELFQPVSLLNSNIESRTALTTVNGKDITVNGTSINSFIPAFVLEFISNDNSRSNVETILGYVLDVATSFAGVGELTKLKYLRVAATGAHEVGLLTLDGIKIVVGGVEFTSGVLGTLANFVQCNPNNTFCNGFKTFIALFQLAALSVRGINKAGQTLESLTTISLRRQAAKIIEAAGGGTDEATIVSNIQAKLTALNSSATTADINETAIAITKTAKGYYLATGLPIYVLEQFINKLLARFKSENSRFKLRTDIPIGSSSAEVPRFSIKKYIQDGIEETSRGSKPKFKNTGAQLFTKEEIKELVLFGKNLGLGDVSASNGVTSVTESLIIKAHRTAKQSTIVEVKEWMTNYENFLNVRKYAYCFRDLNHQEKFIEDLKTILLKYNFQDGLPEMSFTGSVLTKTNPPDLDIVGNIPKAQILKEINRFETIFIQAQRGNIFIPPKILEKISKGFVTSRRELKLRPECIVRVGRDANFRERLFTINDELSRILTENKPVTQKNKFDFNIFNTEDQLRNLPPDLKIN